MPTARPPTIDPVAAQRWAGSGPATSAWLHEEVARRMVQRLQWIKLQPQAWADWEPVGGGLDGHAAVSRRYPRAACYVVEPASRRAARFLSALHKPWWRAARWSSPSPVLQAPGPRSVQMVWANMALHMAADPQAMIGQWHQALAADGFLMFSCLGPDSLLELRRLYRRLAWPPPGHDFTDMHDWGDMLVEAGFAEPVMDVERIRLTFPSGERLLSELRHLGRNLHPQRYQALRGKNWRRRLVQELEAEAAAAGQDQPIGMTFEVIYGHAVKAPPRLAVRPESVVPLDDMRSVLQRRKVPPAGRA